MKKARGTYRPSRSPKELGFPVVTKLAPPAWLDDRAVEEWNRVVPLLDAVRVLTDADLSALGNYCVAVSIAIRATLSVNKNLMSTRSHRINPMIKVAKEARAECLRYAVEFGLTPASRSRVASAAAAGDGGDEQKPSDDGVPLFGAPKLVVTK